MGSQTIFCSWYFYACGGRSVACYYLIISSQSYCLLQKCLHDHGLQCSCGLSWKDCYSTMSLLREWPSFIIKQLSQNVLQMWIMAKIIYSLSTAMIQHLFQLLTVSMNFDQALKPLWIFLTAGLCSLYFPLWALLIWKLENSFDGFLLGRSSHISPCNFYWPSFI